MTTTTWKWISDSATPFLSVSKMTSAHLFFFFFHFHFPFFPFFFFSSPPSSSHSPPCFSFPPYSHISSRSITYHISLYRITVIYRNKSYCNLSQILLRHAHAPRRLLTGKEETDMKAGLTSWHVKPPNSS